MKSNTSLVRYKDDLFTDALITEGEYLPGLPFLFYEPQGDTSKSRFWIMVFHAGGGTIQDLRTWCLDLCKKGYCVANVEWKAPGNSFDSITDQLDASMLGYEAIEYFRSNAAIYGIRKSKLFLLGSSAGAILAVIMGIMVNVRDKYLPLATQAKMLIRATASLSGAALDYFRDMIQINMPANLFIHGEKDLTVKFSEALATYEAEVKAGVNSQKMFWPDADHKLGHYEENKKAVVDHFYNNHKNKNFV